MLAKNFCFGIWIYFHSSFSFTFRHVIVKLLILHQQIFAFFKSICIKLFLPSGQSNLPLLLYTRGQFGSTSHETIFVLFVVTDLCISIVISIFFIGPIRRTVDKLHFDFLFMKFDFMCFGRWPSLCKQCIHFNIKLTLLT